MRTRTRMLGSFLAAHVLLTLVVGTVSYQVLHHFLRQQAEESARSLVAVLTGGGFSLSERVQARMAELTGYEFRIIEIDEQHLERPYRPPPRTISMPYASGIIEIDYHTPRYRAALNAVLIGSFLMGLLGTVIFAVIAWRLSLRLARPLEDLARAATDIGNGDWQRPVPRVGVGEVLNLATDLERMRQQLQAMDERNRQAERLATLGLFTATIAHEVRNPLSAVRLTVQLLRQRHPSEQALAVIDEEMERLDDTVDELLGFSKGMTIEPVACALHEVAHTVLRLLQRQARHAAVTISVHGAATVHADPRRMRQLLLNLVLNAIQALSPQGGGMVEIHIAEGGLRVDDDGPGIGPAQAAQLFTPFASEREGGTGLGLHLAHLIAERHGATLSYAPRDTQGSSFILDGLPPA